MLFVILQSVNAQTLTKPTRALTFTEIVRTERSLTYQSHYADYRYLKKVKNGDRMPVDAVRPFGRPLLENGKRIDYAVAKWVPKDKMSVWGKAWEENGVLKALFFHENTIKTNDHPDIVKGYYILIYNGTHDQNGFRFSWELAKTVDGGTVVYSGANRHVAGVYADPHSGSEHLGDVLWDERVIEFVHSGRTTADIIDNSGEHFDNNVYVLTKQRCNCQCS